MPTNFYDEKNDMLASLANGCAIAVAGDIKNVLPSVPTTQELTRKSRAEHRGYGLFVADLPYGDSISFDGGASMRRVYNDNGDWMFSWTPVWSKSGDQGTWRWLEIDVESQRIDVHKMEFDKLHQTVFNKDIAQPRGLT